MDFTRQPIIETVITAKEGFKLVVRSSKGSGQEEYFVDAVEVVSFGNSFFFRSTEKPKAFLVPATDYEILEVREARMVLKNVGFDKTIKIGGGKEGSLKLPKESEKEKPYEQAQEEGEEASQNSRSSVEKKRDRRKSLRRRRGREETGNSSKDEESSSQETQETIDLISSEMGILEEPKIELGDKIELPEPKKVGKKGRQAAMEISGNLLKSLLPPPPNLISDTIDKYRQSELFKDVFFKEEKQEKEKSFDEEERGEEQGKGAVEDLTGEASSEENKEPLLSQPEYGSFEVSQEEEEKIYQQRKKTHFTNDFEEPFEIFGDKPYNSALFETEQSFLDFDVSKEWLEELPQKVKEESPQEESNKE
ncbi:hypothetical protein [Criblamydia sequanensis]|uniref:Uncharacterized protein n=1 Tax=Candidatus Criblamydia sequanensis CRIB-18 TaxID=1437425 RepID=A0A090CXW1_9BACT|nr:hypothetical protein [Criblamydia sequanensis]CDR33077.1 conserved hypothetical protein [Criblamydia sequanensis CRIB-18]